MSDDTKWPPEGQGRRWEDPPGVLEFRILALEKDRDDHETRLRATETAVQKIDVMDEKLTALTNAAREANTGAWRNFWTAIIGVASVIATVLGTHFFK